MHPKVLTALSMSPISISLLNPFRDSVRPNSTQIDTLAAKEVNYDQRNPRHSSSAMSAENTNSEIHS